MVITHHVIEYTSPPQEKRENIRGDITRDITQFSNLTSGRIKAIVSNIIQDG